MHFEMEKIKNKILNIFLFISAGISAVKFQQPFSAIYLENIPLKAEILVEIYKINT